MTVRSLWNKVTFSWRWLVWLCVYQNIFFIPYFLIHVTPLTFWKHAYMKKKTFKIYLFLHTLYYHYSRNVHPTGLTSIFAFQGNSFIDPLRYLGVACVISGSFCVCLAMCRWLGRPISVSSHRVNSIDVSSFLSSLHYLCDLWQS